MPSKLREQLGSEVVISFSFGNVLEIRTKDAFQDWSNSLLEKGNFKKEARELQRLVLGNSFELSIDKAGRVNIPDNLIALVKLEKEVTLIGVGDKLEIHSTSAWEAVTDDSEDLANKMEELAAMLAGE